MNELYKENNETTQKDESNLTLSLLGVGKADGVGGEELDMQSMRGPSKLLGHGTMFIVMLFVIAAGSLYAMRVTRSDLTVSASTTTEIEAKIEQALIRLSSPTGTRAGDSISRSNIQSLFEDTDSVLQMFAADVNDRQVPIQYVKKNPFTMTLERRAESGATTAVVVDRRAEALRQELQREFGMLQLQTVVQGRVPVAIINGELVQVNQKLGSFKVKEISQTSVVLEATDGTAFALKMADESAKTPGHR